MKLKHLIITAVLIAVLTLSAASADEDVNVTSESLSDDAPSADARLKPEIYFSSCSGELYASDEPSLWVDFTDEDITGTLSLMIDDVEKAKRPLNSSCISFDFAEFAGGLEYNRPYNLTFIYSGDLKYDSWNVTDVFTLNYIKFDSLTDLSVDVQQWAEVELAKDGEGEVSLYFDNALYDTQSVVNGKCLIWLKDLEYGVHTYEFRYGGDKKYPAQNTSGVVNVSYLLDVGVNDGDTFIWGGDVALDIKTPGVCGELQLNQNGVIKTIALDEDGYAAFVLDGLKFGANKLVFTYAGGYKYPQRTLTLTVNVIENVTCPREIGYSSADGISVRLPDDAEGDILVFENTTQIAGSKLENGIAYIDLSMLMPANHSITLNYTGDDYTLTNTNFSFAVIPYIDFPKSVGAGDEHFISLTLPKDAGGFFTAVYNNVTVGCEEIVNGSARIMLNLTRSGENQSVNVNVNSNYGNFTKKLNVNVRDRNRNGQLAISLPQRLVYDSSSGIAFYLADYACGTLYINISDKRFLLPVEDGYASVSISDLADGLEFGNYTLTASYSGDDYYNPISNQTVLEVTFIDIIVPQTVEIGGRDYILIYYSENAYCPLELYAGGKYVKSSYPLEDIDFISYFDLSDFDFGENQNIEIRYPGTGPYEPFTKKYSVNVSYRGVIIDDNCIYGEPCKLLIRCYGDINGQAALYIDNNSYIVNLTKGNGEFEIDGLDIGKYNVSLIYDGDSIYPKKIISDEIEIIPGIHAEDINYIGGDNNVSLTLPDDACGNLTVLIEDMNSNTVLNKTSPLKNGKAAIPINELKLGNYRLSACYTGNDYSVQPLFSDISVNFKVTWRDLGNWKKNILMELPEDAEGTISAEVYGGEGQLFSETFALVRGKANFTIEVRKEYDARITYAGSDYGNHTQSVYLNPYKLPVSINITIPKKIIAKDLTTLTFALPEDATGTVWVLIDDDYFTGKVKNGKSVVDFSAPHKGIMLIEYGFEGDGKYESASDYTYINVLKGFTVTADDLKIHYGDKTSFNVKVFDGNGKAVYGKYVDFYIKDKLFKSVKTDKNGVAKLKINLKPKKYRLTVKYRGAEITKKLTVKHVLKLKPVTVKRSAKRLVLKATLKKPLKNKKITFMFNGKKYVTKTSKKGVAKVIIKKSELKKLKTGSYVKYGAGYHRDKLEISTLVRK